MLRQSRAMCDESQHAAKKKLVLRWSRLHKTVQISESTGGLLRSSIAGKSAEVAASTTGNKATRTKLILNEISGMANPGQVLALMGPSGSGKTTLLNCLSCRVGYDSGVVSVNGTSISEDANLQKRLMSKIAYVRQSDIFFEELTVRDQMAYTAFLRLAGTREEKLKEVDRILKLLRLTKVENSPIRLCSGGEKKRVNIGTELLTDPYCLLLDEPTSGLDSTSAVSLIQVLQHLARSEGKTIVTSIHQPSSGVFRSFDKLLMLSEGSVVYFGTPVGSLGYLREQNLACPDGYNAADHWMDLLVKDDVRSGDESDLGRTGHDSLDIESQDFIQASAGVNESQVLNSSLLPSSSAANKKLIDAWDNEGVAKAADAEVEKAEDTLELGGSDFQKYNTTWMTQYRVLMHRAMKNSRSAIFTPLNMIKSAALGIVTGLLWFQLDYTEKTAYDRSSYFFFTMTYWVFDSMFGALMAFPQERTVVLKERSSKSYHLSAYFMAKTTSEAPTRLILPSIYMVISFWLAGISNKFSIFLLSTLVSLLSVVAGESIGLLVGASIYDGPRAMTVITVVSLTLMLLGGFFVENPPAFIAWGKYLSPFKYAFDASILIVFDHPVPCDGSGRLEGLCVDDLGSVPAEKVTEFLGAQGSAVFNAGMLLLTAVIPRYLAYLALRAKKEGER